MKDEAEDLIRDFKEKYGERVVVEFIDVTTKEFDNYPRVKEIMSKVRLPLTVINGTPRFHGGLSLNMITDSIEGLLADK